MLTEQLVLLDVVLGITSVATIATEQALPLIDIVPTAASKACGETASYL
jgi:hypothetical protein